MKSVEIEMSEKEYRRCVKAANLNTKFVQYNIGKSEKELTKRERKFLRTIIDIYGFKLIIGAWQHSFEADLNEDYYKTMRRVQ